MKLSLAALQRSALTQPFCRGLEAEEDGGRAGGPTVQMCLWCLNPALAFNAMADPAHAIILTSGTLAPMATFASEVCRFLMMSPLPSSREPETC